MLRCPGLVKVLAVIAIALSLVVSANPAEALAVDYFAGSFSSEGSAFSYDVPSDITTAVAVRHANFAQRMGVRGCAGTRRCSFLRAEQGRPLMARW